MGDLVAFVAGGGEVVGGIFDGAVGRRVDGGAGLAEVEDLGAGELAEAEAVAEGAAGCGEGGEGDLVEVEILGTIAPDAIRIGRG